MTDKPLRVVVVDDSVVYRKVVQKSLASCPDVEVVGVAADGQFAVQVIEMFKPDLVTLDIDMPKLDGIGVLREIQRRKIDVAVIMISSLTQAGAELTNTALELGAFDFVLKPDSDRHDANEDKLRQDLCSKIEAYKNSRRIGSSLAPSDSPPASSPPVRTNIAPSSPSNNPPQIVVIGVSTGGPIALGKILPALPADFPLPVVVVQHMPPVFTRSLANSLDSASSIRVEEGEDDMPVVPGKVYIAPGGRQLKLERSGAGSTILRVTDDPVENNCRPSVDYLFRSTAKLFEGNTLGIVLTGMGNDGTEGCRRLKECGARIITQDEPSCVVYGMPRCVVDAGLADIVCPLDRIPKAIMQEVAGAMQCC